MSVTHKITLNVDKDKLRLDQRVHVRCGDKSSQVVSCSMRYGGSAWTPNEGSTAKLEILKPDNTWTVTAATISGSTVRGTVPLAAMSAPGECRRAYFRIINASGSTEDTTEDFYLYVLPNATQDAIESSSYTDEFDALLEASESRINDLLDEVDSLEGLAWCKNYIGEVKNKLYAMPRLKVGDSITISHENGTEHGYCDVKFFDENGTQLGYYSLSANAAKRTVTVAEGSWLPDAAYLSSAYVSADSRLQVEFGQDATEFEEHFDNVKDLAGVRDDIDAIDMTLRREKAFVYIANNHYSDNLTVTEGISGGKITIHFPDKLILRLPGETSTSMEWEEITAGLNSANYTIDGNACDITLASYSHALVYSVSDRLLRDRNYNGILSDDIVLATCSYGYLTGGLVQPMVFNNKIAAAGQSDMAHAFNSSPHEDADDFAVKCEQFSYLMYGDTIADVAAPSDIESFMFFTDPHLLEGTNWHDRCYQFISVMQKYYNSTPTSFCLCGGDWLGNSDSPSSACFKLGYIDGFMRFKFHDVKMLVGNHDTNYQGKLTPSSATYTTRLSDQAIMDLWYRGGKAYYEFDGTATRFFCFDTGIENQALSTFGGYGYEQAEWFASSLESNTAEHVAIAAHILYPLSSSDTLQPLAALVLQIAEAFNSRGTVTVDGNEHDFASASGKVEFALFGHSHRDAEYVLNGIPCVMTTNVTTSVSSGPTFDLVMADYGAGKLNLVRVGSGSDRIVNL